jgi:hypothetical protein
MTTYNISLVLLIPALHQPAINALAESLGWGPDSLSVQLKDAEGNDWYGSHSWVAPGFLEMLADPPEGSPLDALAALKVSAVGGGDPLENWNQALEENGLLRVEVDV